LLTRRGVRDLMRKRSFGHAPRSQCAAFWLPYQRRTRATMMTISRIKPSVPPPIQNTSPSIGVINALIVFFLKGNGMPPSI